MTKRTAPYSPEVRERAVRMVSDRRGEHASQDEAIRSIAQKIGCSGETLRNWVRQRSATRASAPGCRPMSASAPRLWSKERETPPIQLEFPEAAQAEFVSCDQTISLSVTLANFLDVRGSG